MDTRFVDLSHAIEHGLVTYRGLPAPVVCDFLSREASRAHYAPGTEFHIGRIDMVGNTGTYVDAPFHRFAGRADLAELPLASLADLPAVVVDATQRGRAIGAEVFAGLDVRGRAVLVRTDHSAHFATERYFEGHPFLTRAAAAHLVAHGARLVAIDSLNIDDTADLARPAHTLLLGADIPVAEHLTNLAALPASGLRFSAVPARVRAFGTFPVRAYARLLD
jgi:kynurenine formamidase